MSILDCVGQDRGIARLQRAYRVQRIPHSYVFHGPPGVGKALLARQWAKLLLCGQPVQRAWSPADSAGSSAITLEQIDDCCDQCSDCHLVDVGTHPDLHLISKELARHTSQARARQLISLPIDVIREFVIERAGNYPSRRRARVFIIEEAQTMNRASQNALLKTLEEPPSRTFLILITCEPRRFLPTVRSRCQSVRFGPLPREFVYDRLIAEGVKEDQGRYLADFCAGQLGPALELARMDLYAKKCAIIEKLSQLTYGSVLQMAGEIAEDAKDFAQSYLKLQPDSSPSDALRQGQMCFLRMLSHAFSVALRQGAEGAESIAEGVDQPANIQQIMRKYRTSGCARAIRATARAESALGANVNPALIFESLMVEYLSCAFRGPWVSTGTD